MRNALVIVCERFVMVLPSYRDDEPRSAPGVDLSALIPAPRRPVDDDPPAEPVERGRHRAPQPRRLARVRAALGRRSGPVGRWPVADAPGHPRA